MPTRTPDKDPVPVAPVRPDNEDCCRGGCTPCVFDLYAQEMERYRAELRAWQERQAGQKRKPKSSGGR